MPTRRPVVVEAREFLEITRDFTDPKDVIREAISNSIDWGADEIKIAVTEDRTRPDEELVIEIEDNGLGMNEERLHAFFDLGRTTEGVHDNRIGYKGHGTKTYYNSRKIEVWSNTTSWSVHAIMENPLQTLMNDEIPEYTYEIEQQNNAETGTRVKICGYNINRRKQDFGHSVLKDFIVWKTKFGSVEKEFGLTENANKKLYLKGLGKSIPEEIEFGHRFARENSNLRRLMQERPGGWTKVFCKKWVFQDRPIIDNPGKSIDMVFYIEGDEAKRSYNDMIRVRGRTPTYGMYKVEERYGLWACKDCIPIKRYNEWLGLGKRLETKYHAFVNCQEFRLTANRADIGNTPPDLLTAIEETVLTIFEEEIIGSTDYQSYEEAAELEEQYQTSRQERRDFNRRRRRVARKKVCEIDGLELIEPGVEMGVIALFNLVYARNPQLFPFKVIDYDTKRGYDALVSQQATQDLSRESMYFIEFKYMLSTDFNHSFDHLTAIICWDCNLADGAELTDIQNNQRQLRITPPENEDDYTHYMLVSLTQRHNIEVFVLKEYLREKMGIEFHARQIRR